MSTGSFWEKQWFFYEKKLATLKKTWNEISFFFGIDHGTPGTNVKALQTAGWKVTCICINVLCKTWL